MEDDPGRVLVVTAGIGAGHVAVARELERRLVARGAAVTLLDLIEDVPRSGPRLRRTYQFLLRRAPWVYDLSMRYWARHPVPMQRLTAVGERHFTAALRQVIDRVHPGVVVSTFNLGSQCLGRMRSGGELAMPVITIVTDPGAHPYWIGPGVDEHLAYLPRTVADLTRMGAPARVVRPLVRPGFADAVDRDAARARLGVSGLVVLVTAGSWVSGTVGDTLAALTGQPGLTLVVLCAHDERLRRSLDGVPGVRALPWTDDVLGWLAACDVVVDNAGGLTCWEALAVGRAVVMHRPLAGHGRFNARTLAASGLVSVTTDAERLRGVVRTVRPARFEPTGPDAADVVLSWMPARA